MITAEEIEDWVKHQVFKHHRPGMVAFGITHRQRQRWAVEVFEMLKPAILEASKETILKIKIRMLE